MADESDTLSDAQLRDQLKLFGVNTGPVTATTRSLLKKKLKSLKSGESSPSTTASKAKKRRSIATSSPSRQKTKLAGFSSEEEDFPVKKAVSVDSPSAASRRRSAFPRVNYIKSQENDDSEESNLDDDRVERPTTFKPVGRRSLTRTNVRETRSLDTLPGGAKNGPSMIYDEDSEDNLQKRPNYRKNSFEFDDDDAAGVLRKKSDEKESAGMDKKTQKVAKEIRSDRDFSSVSSQISSKESLMSTVTTRRRRATRDQTDAGKEEDDSKYAQDNGQDDEELELAFASNSGFLKSWRGPAFVIFVLVLLVCLVGSYLSLWSNRMAEWPALPDFKDQPSDKGINRDHVFEVLQCLHDKLSIYAGEEECGYPGAKVNMNGEDIGTFAAKCKTSFTGNLVNYENLAVNVVNLAVDEKYSEFFSVQDDRVDISKPITAKTLKSITLSSKTAVKPLMCRIKQATQMLSKYLFGILLALGFLLGIYYLMKIRWMMDDEDTRLMFIFVEKIIETLRIHHDACQHDKELPSYLPIPHVRDMLIPPRERKQKARAWTKAVEFLSSTDSRIRVETQRIAGEDFEVWRWIGVTTTDKKVRGASNHLGPEDERGKFWQGPAFDKLEKVVRLPIITPTPCLKIRYLHGGPAEKEEGWDRQVRDALLEKCSEDGAKILHIYVDVKSVEGCVYVKCDSLESAGKAFRSIYGNWFDGRLVIVKFVTVARYNQRFPDALTCTEPLQITGEFPSSLSWNNPDAKTPASKEQ